LQELLRIRVNVRIELYAFCRRESKALVERKRYNGYDNCAN